jgi:DNA gyrase inhibitor GyrI
MSLSRKSPEKTHLTSGSRDDFAKKDIRFRDSGLEEGHWLAIFAHHQFYSEMTQHSLVQRVHLNGEQAISATGMEFTGDYSQSPQYVSDLQKYLTERGIDYYPFKVLGVYYDDPQVTPLDKLRSFQGLFLTDERGIDIGGLQTLTLKGEFILVRVEGDFSSLLAGYHALFEYAKQHGLQFDSPAGYQISSFVNGKIETDIYMQLRISATQNDSER